MSHQCVNWTLCRECLDDDLYGVFTEMAAELKAEKDMCCISPIQYARGVVAAMTNCGSCGGPMAISSPMCPKCGNRPAQGLGTAPTFDAKEIATQYGVGTRGKLKASGREFTITSTGCNGEVDITFTGQRGGTATVKGEDLVKDAVIVEAVAAKGAEDAPDSVIGYGFLGILTDYMTNTIDWSPWKAE